MLKRLFFLLLLLGGSPASAYIPLDGSDFYCPPNPPAGVTCCEKKMYDNALLGGTVKQPRFVMECDAGEAFYARVPMPSHYGVGGWTEVYTVGTVTANTGSVCFDVQGVVTPYGARAIYVDDAFSANSENVGVMLSNNGATVYKEGDYISTSSWKAWNGATQSNCTATSCDQGMMTLRFTRDLAGVGCSDGKTGKAYMVTVDLYEN